MSGTKTMTCLSGKGHGKNKPLEASSLVALVSSCEFTSGWSINQVHIALRISSAVSFVTETPVNMYLVFKVSFVEEPLATMFHIHYFVTEPPATMVYTLLFVTELPATMVYTVYFVTELPANMVYTVSLVIVRDLLNLMSITNPGSCKIFRVWVSVLTEHAVFCCKFNLLSVNLQVCIEPSPTMVYTVSLVHSIMF